MMNASDPTPPKRKAESTDPPLPTNKKQVVSSAAAGDYDKDHALEVVRANGMRLKTIPERLRDDEDVVRAAIRNDPWALFYASLRLRGNVELVRMVIAVEPSQIRVASPALLANRDAGMSLVHTNYKIFRYIPKWTDNKEIALAAIHENAGQVDFASPRLKADRDIHLAAASSRWFGAVLRQRSKDIKPFSKEHISILEDREILLEAVRSNVQKNIVAYLPDWCMCDREFALVSIQSKRSFSCFSEKLKSDRELNLLAAKSMGIIRDKFNADREIVLAAVNINGEALFRAAENLRNDREIVLAAVNRNGRALFMASENLQNDREIALAAVVGGVSIGELSESLLHDREIALAAVSRGRGPDELQELGNDLCGDREIVMAALQRCEKSEEFEPPDWFSRVSEELRSDRGVVLEAVRRNGLFLRDCFLRPGDHDREVVEEAIEQNLGSLSFVPDLLRNHPSVIATALRKQIKQSGNTYYALGFVLENIGASLIQKLNDIDDEYKLETNNSDKIGLPELKNVEKWSTAWKQGLWHKLWAIRVASSSLPIEASNAIIGFTDILPDFRLSRQVSEVAPLVEALAEMDMEVNDFLAC